MRKFLIISITVLGFVFSVLGSVILIRYEKQQIAISEYNTNNYSNAVNNFDISQTLPFEPFSFEAWKDYFNKGTAFLQMNNYSGARNNFQISFSLANQNQAKCTITNNWALTFEKNAADYETMFTTTKSEAIKKAAISFLTQASILRNLQSEICIDSDQTYLDSIKTLLTNDVNFLNSLTKDSKSNNTPETSAEEKAKNSQNQLQNQNTGGISEYLNAYDLVNGSTDFQGKKW